MIGVWIAAAAVSALFGAAVVVLIRRQCLANRAQPLPNYVPTFAQRKLRDPEITEPLPVVTDDEEEFHD